jgi:predicted RNA-binding protein with PUA-like domain
MSDRPQLWVFLADPTAYGWPELVRDGTTVWDGIKNSRAQANLRRCAPGDNVLIYHTAPDKAIVGVARVKSAARPDPAHEELVVVDVQPVTALGQPLQLAELKADPVLSGMGFVRMPRVAVWPVSPEQWDRVLELSKTPAKKIS